MTNNNKWIDKLREKMETHQETPPEGLWEDIAKSLPQSRVSQTADGEKRVVTKQTVIGRRWWVAAAAIVLMLIGGGMFYWMVYQNHGDDNGEKIIAKNEVGSTETKQKNDTSDHRIIEDSGDHSNHSDYSDHSNHSLPGDANHSDNSNDLSHVGLPGESNLSNDLETSDVANDPIIPNSPINNSSNNPINNSSNNPINNSSNNPINNSSNNPNVSDNSIVSSERNIIAELDREFTSGRSNGHKIAIGLYATNDIQGISNKSNVVDYAMSNTYMGDVNSAYFSNSMRKMVLQDYYEKQHHYQPVSVGLTGKIGFTDKVAMTTGVVYTLLRSDFTTNVGSSSIDRKQTLHYLGVPVALMYKLWESGGFSSYVSVGGEIDYNIAARMTTEGDKEEIDRDKLQFSAMASVGAQYDFSPYVGLYLEPGVKYYFDNGSNIVNVFKEKKTNFNVQFGLRFNIK